MPTKATSKTRVARRQVPAQPVESNGQSNGHAKEAKATAEVVAATEPEKPAEFVFQPKDDSAPITVPPVLTAVPQDRQRWFFWRLRKLQGLEQPIFWLEQAGIPDPVQERIMLLPEQEWGRFFEEWMASGTGADLGK